MDIDFASQTRLFLGLYETELSRFLRRYCRAGVTCFDIGAQFGYDALVMAKLTQSRVVSVDCEPAAVEQMARNFSANPSLAKNLIAKRAAVGEVTNAADHRVSLDDLALETFVPGVIKIDIEGAEAEALRGASGLLSRTPPALIIEVHGMQAEQSCLEILRSYGYNPTLVNQRRFLADYRPLSHNRWLVAESPGRTASP